jgi:hypothetical protein
MKDDELEKLHLQLVRKVLAKRRYVQDPTVIAKFEKACWKLIYENPTCSVDELVFYANARLNQIIKYPDI